MNYYNEFDPKAAAWLRELIKAGQIPAGCVDERSIKEVQPEDLKEFTQCHFFAGIGGWPYALKLAKWPEDEEIWTGSCPCQPFSITGKMKGFTDERHLWPEFHRLIKNRNPTTVAGEQVASSLGREWLNRVRLDLEELGYAVGAADLCAASVNAPHIRQRLFWLAEATERSGKGERNKSLSIDAKTVIGKLAGWTTPQAHDVNPRSKNQKKKHGTKHGCACLANQAALAGWNTPHTPRKNNSDNSKNSYIEKQIFGKSLKQQNAETEQRGALNPAHSRWLMGYPAAWDSCGAMAMQSCRKSRKSS